MNFLHWRDGLDINSKLENCKEAQMEQRATHTGVRIDGSSTLLCGGF